jgi:hypothetical protein
MISTVLDRSYLLGRYITVKNGHITLGDAEGPLHIVLGTIQKPVAKKIPVQKKMLVATRDRSLPRKFFGSRPRNFSENLPGHTA